MGEMGNVQHTSSSTSLINPYLPKVSAKTMSSGMGTAFGMAEDEDMGQTQDSKEFLNGYHHDNLYNPEGAIGPLDWDQLKFDSTKHRPKKGEQCKIIGIGDIDQHHATFLHVQQLP